MQGFGEGKKEQSVGVEKKLSGGLKMRVMIQIVLRLAAVGASIGAAWLMFTAHQTALVYDVPMDAKYSYTAAFKFYAFANAIASVFAVMSLGLTLILMRHGLEEITSNHHFFFFLHDLGVMGLLLAACSAATAIGYVGQYGNNHAGWLPICDHFTSFCHRVIASVALGYCSFFSFLFLTVLSATKYSATAQFASGQVQNGF